MKKITFASVRKLIVDHKHLLLPLIYLVLYMSAFTYLETRHVKSFLIVRMKLDSYIPFFEYFIIPYVMWFFFIAATVVVFAFLDKKDYYKLCVTLGVGMTVFLIVSYFIPNMQPLRPTTFARDNIFVDMVKFLYSTDTCTNVFPSIHVYNSLCASFAINKNSKLRQKKGLIIGTDILCGAIILSTMFLKQHSLFDVLTGTVMGVVMYWLVYALPSSLAERKNEYEKGLSH